MAKEKEIAPEELENITGGLQMKPKPDERPDPTGEGMEKEDTSTSGEA